MSDVKNDKPRNPFTNDFNAWILRLNQQLAEDQEKIAADKNKIYLHENNSHSDLKLNRKYVKSFAEKTSEI